MQERVILSATSFAETVVWKLSAPLPGSRHRFKYRLTFVVRNVCIVRFDNESGKGDIKHVGSRETPYEFIDLETLRTDFFSEVRSRSSQQ